MCEIYQQEFFGPILSHEWEYYQTCGDEPKTESVDGLVGSTQTLFQTLPVMMVFDRLLTNILCDGLELPNLWTNKHSGYVKMAIENGPFIDDIPIRTGGVQ